MLLVAGDIFVTSTPSNRAQSLYYQFLKERNASVWLEIIYDGDEIVADLQGVLKEAVTGSNLEILRIVNNRIVQQVLQQTEMDKTLETMSEEQVFRRCLDAYDTPQQHSNRNCFNSFAKRSRRFGKRIPMPSSSALRNCNEQ